MRGVCSRKFLREFESLSPVRAFAFPRPNAKPPTVGRQRVKVLHVYKEKNNMKEYDESIQNIEQAKRYFISMGCSHFHLMREHRQRADEYYALKISRDIELQWLKEEFERKLSEINSGDLKDLWWKYSSLEDMMVREDFYLEKMIEATEKIQDFLPTDQISLVLNTAIIGNNATEGKGGLIQKACELNRLDLAYKFIAHTKLFIEKAEKANEDLSFTRGYFVDVIEYLNLKENGVYLKQLREKDNLENFKYYQNSAEEGNKFSMKKLAEYYRNGIGCEKNIEQAQIWQDKADD